MHRKCEAMSMRVTTHVVNSVSGKTFGRFSHLRRAIFD